MPKIIKKSAQKSAKVWESTCATLDPQKWFCQIEVLSQYFPSYEGLEEAQLAGSGGRKTVVGGPVGAARKTSAATSVGKKGSSGGGKVKIEGTEIYIDAGGSGADDPFDEFGNIKKKRTTQYSPLAIFLKQN